MTLRYVDSLPFGRFARRVQGQPDLASSPEGELIGLLQAAASSGAAGDDLKSLVDRGDLEVGDLTGNGEIAGPGIDLIVHNPGPRDIVTTIPCGFIFEPSDGGDQRLMVVQPASVKIPAGGEVSVSG